MIRRETLEVMTREDLEKHIGVLKIEHRNANRHVHELKEKLERIEARVAPYVHRDSDIDPDDTVALVDAAIANLVETGATPSDLVSARAINDIHRILESCDWYWSCGTDVVDRVKQLISKLDGVQAENIKLRTENRGLHTENCELRTKRDRLLMRIRDARSALED